MDDAILWWESVCNGLCHDPTGATKVISEFRESPQAFEIVQAVLQSDNSSPIAKFHAISIYQHLSINVMWPIKSDDERVSCSQFVWQLILKLSQTEVNFLQQKYIQSFALLWKRGWQNYSKDIRQSIVLMTRGLMESLETVDLGARVMRAVLEEFSNRSSKEIQLPLQFHQHAHTSFQEYGLFELIPVGFHCLRQLLSNFSVPTSCHALGRMQSVLSLCNEIFNWNYNGLEIVYARDELYTDCKGSFRVINMPRVLADHIIEATYIASLFDIYLIVRSEIFLAVSEDNHLIRNADGLLQDLRCLIANLCLISGKSFEQDSARISFGNFLSVKLVKLLTDTMSGAYAVALFADCSTNLTAVQRRVLLLHATECLHLASSFQHFFSNYSLSIVTQMESGGVLLFTLGQATQFMSTMLAALSDHIVASPINNNNNVSSIMKSQGSAWLSISVMQRCSILDVLESSTAMTSWIADVLTVLLDTWRVVLDSPELGSSYDESNNIAIRQFVQRALYQTSANSFNSMFEAVLVISLCETLAGADDEYEQDNEDIEDRNLDDFYGNICAIGRTSLVTSLGCVSGVLSRALANSNGLLTQTVTDSQTQLILETIRVCVLFAAHLCIEDFTEDVNIVSTCSETPTIAQCIVDSFYDDYGRGVGDSAVSLKSLVAQVAGVAHLQVRVLSEGGLATKCGASHPLCSPLLVMLVSRYFAAYAARFFAVDGSLYPSTQQPRLEHLVHLHDSELLDIVDALSLFAQHAILILPLEVPTILAVTDIFFSLSRLSVAVPAVLARPAVLQLFGTITGPQSGVSGTRGCRLTVATARAWYRALSCLSVKNGDQTVFQQLCSSVHSRVMQLTQSQTRKEAEHRHELLVSLACLQGMAACPADDKRVLHRLFSECLPVTECLCRTDCLNSDELLMGYMLLLRDYSEVQLPVLAQPLSSALYRATMTLLEVVAHRMHASAQSRINSEDFNNEFMSECLQTLLQLLNHLSTKDFLLESEGEDTDPNAMSAQEFESQVSHVLLQGLAVAVPLISADLLRSYPVACDRYFAFIAFVVSAYEDDIVQLLSAWRQEDQLTTSSASSSSSSQCVSADATGGRDEVFVTRVMQHLLWAAGAVDNTSARLALQGLHSLCRLGVRLGRQLAMTVFPPVTSQLLLMILCPDSSCEYGLGYDRLDAAGHALISLIALDPQGFHATVQRLISSYPSPQLQSALLGALQKLTTARGVNITSVDRQNRNLFVQNLREFVVEARPMFATLSIK